MRYNLLLISFLLSFTSFFAQSELLSIEASLETESFHRTILKNSKIYFFRSINSREITEKKCIISCYDQIDLKQCWSKEIIIGQYQNVVNYTLIRNVLNVFLVNHDLDSNTSTLSNLQFDSQNGYLINNTTLWKANIGKWVESDSKAEVAQSFLSAMDSKQSEADVTPLDYKIYFGFSPDSSLFYAYRFDNSQERLYTEARIYRCNTNDLLHEVRFAIDDAHIAYSVKIDNLGEVYQLKVSQEGKLAVLKINPQNELSSYLQLSNGSTSKTNPQLFIHKNHQAYLAYCNVKGDYLQGVSVALLDFDKEAIEDHHYYAFDSEFLKRQESQLKNGNHYFELAEIEEVNDHLLLILEQHMIEGIDISYEPNATEKIGMWHQRNATVTTGNIALLAFDKELNPISCLEIPKTQKGSIFDGLNTLGHHLVIKDGEAFFIYSKSTKGFVNDKLIVQKLDKTSTRWVEYRQVSLDNGYIPVITSSNIIDNTRILVHSRKGITGKDNYLKIYEY